MKSYYLKATGEQALWEALETASLASRRYNLDDPKNIAPEDPDAEWSGPSGDYVWELCDPAVAVAIVGKIEVPTGNSLVDEDGGSYPEMQAVSGYHANVLGDLTPEQEAALPLIEAPSTPHVVWASEPDVVVEPQEELEVTGLTSNDIREVDPAAAGDGTLPPPLWADEESLGDENG